MDYAAWVQRALAFVERCRRLPGTVNVEAAVAAPLNGEALRNLQKQLRIPLPACVARFLTEASAACGCHYWWEPVPFGQATRGASFGDVLKEHCFIYGGARLCVANDLGNHQDGCWDWAIPAVVETPDMVVTRKLEREEFAARFGLSVTDLPPGPPDPWKNAPEARRLWQQSVPFLAIANGDYVVLDMRQPTPDPAVYYLDHDGPEGTFLLAPNFDTFLREWEALCFIGPEAWLLDEFYDQETRQIDSTSAAAVALRDLFARYGVRA